MPASAAIPEIVPKKIEHAFQNDVNQKYYRQKLSKIFCLMKNVTNKLHMFQNIVSVPIYIMSHIYKKPSAEKATLLSALTIWWLLKWIDVSARG